MRPGRDDGEVQSDNSTIGRLANCCSMAYRDRSVQRWDTTDPTTKIVAYKFENYDDHHHLAAMGEAFDPEDFSFVVKMRGGAEKPWIWEVHARVRQSRWNALLSFIKLWGKHPKRESRALARILKAGTDNVQNLSHFQD